MIRVQKKKRKGKKKGKTKTIFNSNIVDYCLYQISGLVELEFEESRAKNRTVQSLCYQ